MKTSEANTLGLFFFLTLLDEKLSLQKASDAHDKIRKFRKKNPKTLNLLSICLQILKQTYKKYRVSPQIKNLEHIHLNADLNSWIQFVEKNKIEDIAVIVSYVILKMDPKEIAEAFQVSVETIERRVYQSLKKISQLKKTTNISLVKERLPIQTDGLELSKYNKRVMLPFFAENYVLDYINNKLDPERKRSFEFELQQNVDLKNTVAEIKSAIDYLSSISDINISVRAIQQISIPTSYAEIINEQLKIDQWPESIRWMSEALGVVIIVAVFAILMPWSQLMNQIFYSANTEIVLTEIKKIQESEVVGTQVATVPAQQDKPLYSDEGVAKTVVAVTPTPAISPTPQETKVTQTAKPSPTVTPTTVAATAVEVTNVVKTGFLFRGSLETSNLAVVSSRIRDQIEQFGGRKAGEVELGWKRGNSSYFHFTVPESKYEELTQFLKSYGDFKIQKEKHERVMPDGIVRMIILVEESNKP